ncbi:MAG TPA: alpha/beta hydrolase [Acidimicrobiales bacterium]|nr:alpha/beta hydrolase [Acidimicrobiales bacterium]
MIHPAFDSYLRQARENPAAPPMGVTAGERRQAFRDEALAMRGEMAPMALLEDRELALEGRTLKARLYVPVGEEAQTLVIYFHGGSFVTGDLVTHEWLCRRLAFDTQMRLLAIDYRLAPEHPFPAPLNDALDSIRYVASHRSEFADERARLIVMGDSAGANLATVAATQLRDESLGISAQVLIYPTLGPELVTDSAHRYGSGYLLDLDDLRYDYGLYLGEFGDHTDPRVTPLLCSDLARVAPALVVVAECDPLRDEGVAYAGLLTHFGVSVELLEAKGMVHGFLEMGGVVPEALAIVDDFAEHLHRLVEVPRA